MECSRFKNWNLFWNRQNKFPRLDLDSDYTGIIYTLCVNLSGPLKQEGSSYCKYGNTTLPDYIRYSTQL